MPWRLFQSRLLSVCLMSTCYSWFGYIAFYEQVSHWWMLWMLPVFHYSHQCGEDEVRQVYSDFTVAHYYRAAQILGVPTPLFQSSHPAWQGASPCFYLALEPVSLSWFLSPGLRVNPPLPFVSLGSVKLALPFPTSWLSLKIGFSTPGPLNASKSIRILG